MRINLIEEGQWSVLPIHVRDGWQVETALLDRGDGVREWVEVRHDGGWEKPTAIRCCVQRPISSSWIWFFSPR